MLAIMFNFGVTDTPYGPETLCEDMAEAHRVALEHIKEWKAYDARIPVGYWLLNAANFVTAYYSVAVKPIEYVITQEKS